MNWHLREINGLRKHNSTTPIDSIASMNPLTIKNAIVETGDDSKVDLPINVEENKT